MTEITYYLQNNDELSKSLLNKFKNDYVIKKVRLILDTTNFDMNDLSIWFEENTYAINYNNLIFDRKKSIYYDNIIEIPTFMFIIFHNNRNEDNIIIKALFNNCNVIIKSIEIIIEKTTNIMKLIYHDFSTYFFLQSNIFKTYQEFIDYIKEDYDSTNGGISIVDNSDNKLINLKEEDLIGKMNFIKITDFVDNYSSDWGLN